MYSSDDELAALAAGVGVDVALLQELRSKFKGASEAQHGTGGGF